MNKVFTGILAAVLALSISANLVAAETSGRNNYGYRLVGDFNHDCIVDEQDFQIFCSLYDSKRGDGTYRGYGDLNKDGVINHIDFAIFADSYGKTCGD